MKKVLVIHLNDTETEERVEFLGQQIQLIYKGTLGDGARAAALLAEYDGKVDAIALDGLPAEARAYIKRMEQLCDFPVDMISTGPDREETIVLRHPFA